jgi:hypothetical protein
MEETATKITQILKRDDGGEVKIVAEAMYGAGLARSIGVYVHRRESSDHDWILCSDRPHQDWRKMTVEEYTKNGRSEMLKAVSPGEILKVTNLIGRSIDAINAMSPATAEDKIFGMENDNKETLSLTQKQ